MDFIRKKSDKEAKLADPPFLGPTKTEFVFDREGAGPDYPASSSPPCRRSGGKMKLPRPPERVIFHEMS